MMLRKLVWLILLSYYPFTLTDSIQDHLSELLGIGYDMITIKKYDLIIKKNAYVMVIEDVHGNKFCVKQKKTTQPNAICAVVASYIAELCNIPVNRIRIIPTYLAFPGKKFEEEVALLLTFAPGKNRAKGFPHKLSLEQHYRPDQKKRGLRIRAIQDMSLHQDLPRILAFDTFIGNSDRSNNNLFYDRKTNHFCGIDLELAFKLPNSWDLNDDWDIRDLNSRDLSKIAGDRVEQFISNKTIFTLSELRGLIIYNETLKELLEKNPPEKLHELLDRIAQLSGLLKNPDKKLLRCLQFIKRRMSMQYKSTQRLVRILDDLIEQQTL